jgi:F420-non-reducing hydrogenase iron-sulfur subunit
MAKFEPKIIGFLCNWCAYAGADLAGTSRIQYPANLRTIRVMCSGRVDPGFILKAFAEGADGVFIGGCHPGQCHYVAGNYSAERRVNMLYDLLEDLGIERERLLLKWINAAEGELFASVMRDFTEKLKKLGPSPLKVRLEEETVADR